MATGSSDRKVNAAALRARRQELYPSRADFCAAAEISYSYAGFIERGTHQPRPRIARAIAEALGWDVEQLYVTDEQVAA